MVSTPRLGVRRDNIGRKLPKDRFPPRSITTVVAHHQIWSVANVEARVNVLGLVDAGDGCETRHRITDSQQPLSNLVHQTFSRRPWHDGAVAFAAPQIQVKPVQAQTKGARARPVDVAQEVAGSIAAIGAGLERDVPVLEQPGI